LFPGKKLIARKVPMTGGDVNRFGQGAVSAAEAGQLDQQFDTTRSIERDDAV
jgi:hypothetical protein